MPCLLTKGFALDCLGAVGGIKEIYITELANKASITASGGVISAFTLSTGKQFWTYALDKEDSEWIETETNGGAETGTLFYEQVLTFTMKKMDSSKRAEIRLLAVNRVMIIIKDANDNYLLMGETGAFKVGTNEARTGKAMSDFNGYNMAFTAKEPISAQFINAGVIPALLLPAA